MADEIILNNYSDDAQIKKYISEVLAPRVFKNIPLNVLNTGSLSIINEYMSQAIEQMAFTSSFYFNESFITKAVLPDSIYSEAAIFNIGYSYATPSSCNFLLELKIEDIHNNAVLNADTGLYEFILDKDTKFNLSNGSVYSLDYDILIQYKNVETTTLSSSVQAWNVQYTNRDSLNSIATNKNVYIMYRVTDTWLCLFVTASEYERQVHRVVNNMTNNIPNQDTVIQCNNHIAGFDIKYIDGNGNEQFIPHDHILPIHSNVTDTNPYVHYIMDNPQTIRFMWQLNGNKYFVPKVNSSYEIIVYICHGEAANFSAFNNDEQPQVITASNRYSNNGNVMKAAFVISGSLGGTNIGTTETVRRETIEAYNTANVISSDHDLEEWFKTFYFKNILYPFFFKRRDDPWGRIWSGYIALKDSDDYIYRTNTLHGKIPYDVLYNNDENTINSSEIIIPPGWIWVYNGENRYTVTPYTGGDGVIVEKANSLADVSDKFIFANPFGVRIQKDPFAIGYFNPWINEYVTATHMDSVSSNTGVDNNYEDASNIYHATPIVTNIVRTYQENYYKLTTYISPTISEWTDGSSLVKYVQQNAVPPTFPNAMWKYFKEPMDYFSSDIPLLPLRSGNGYLPFDPEKTYFCVSSKIKADDDTWTLNGTFWIDDESDAENFQHILLPITITSGVKYRYYGDDSVWGDEGLWSPVYVTGDTVVKLYNNRSDTAPETHLTFERVASQNYYELRLDDEAQTGQIESIQVSEATKTDLTKFGETSLVKIGKSYERNIYINIKFRGENTYSTYTINNSASVYIPWDGDIIYEDDGNGNEVPTFNLANIGSTGIILYVDMKPTPEAGAIDHFRIPLSSLSPTQALFHIENEFLQLSQNNMRVILHAGMNGAETGRIEMRPVSKESDGSFKFETEMFPLNQLVDIDDRINIASIKSGGGSWNPTTEGAVVSISATNPELKMSILIRSNIPDRTSDISVGDQYTGYRLVDQYRLDDVSLVQELKEMRSVVNFGDSSIPSDTELKLYNDMLAINTYNNMSDEDLLKYGNLWNIKQYSYGESIEVPLEGITFPQIQQLALLTSGKINNLLSRYESDSEVNPDARVSTSDVEKIVDSLKIVINGNEKDQVPSYDDSRVVTGYYFNNKFYTDINYSTEIIPDGEHYYMDISKDIKHDNESLWAAYKYYENEKLFEECVLICWKNIDMSLSTYDACVNKLFENTNVTGGVEIQLMPFVEYSLMNSSRFKNFVSSFTQVHKALEPVIMKRLEGNNYLDCKLTATYGLPHSYSADVDASKEGYYWPDLNVQIEFDVKLYNQSLATNTLNELRMIVKSYFNRLTNIHTPVDLISMNNNIYVSHLIQQMEAHDNVAYMKFKGWYTNEKNKTNGNYKDANIQAIVQKWRRLEDFPKYYDETRKRMMSELENFVPEMFVLEDKNIVLNIIQ